MTNKRTKATTTAKTKYRDLSAAQRTVRLSVTSTPASKCARWGPGCFGRDDVGFWVDEENEQQQRQPQVLRASLRMTRLGCVEKEQATAEADPYGMTNKGQSNNNGKDEIQGSLHCATDGETVH